MTDFFLDNELTDLTISPVAKICAASPYSIDELNRKMLTEVWPAFLPNLMSYAGEWAGWKEEFIKEQILKCYKPRFYIFWRINPIKRYFCHQWSTVERGVIQARTGAAGQDS
ncbi:MAG: hypothetical protein V4695_10770 [Pseudomonadota bacterium]